METASVRALCWRQDLALICHREKRNWVCTVLPVREVANFLGSESFCSSVGWRLYLRFTPGFRVFRSWQCANATAADLPPAEKQTTYYED